jgi:PAS domain S-box-containing protein
MQNDMASPSRNDVLTREIEARQTAEAAERRFRDLIEDLEGIVWEADAETLQFSFVSRRAEEILGYPAELWLAEPGFFAAHIHPEDRDITTAFFRALNSEGSRREIEYRMLSASGEVVWLRNLVHVCRDQRGLQVQLRGVMVDITRGKRTEAELEQFAYIASHDLHEPLRMVARYVQLLGDRYRGKLDADADEFIFYAVDGVTRMQRLITDLLEFSRAGRRHVAERIAVSWIFDQTLFNLRAAIEESGATVTSSGLPTVAADAMQMMQLLQNLIGNAIKFRGEEPPRVHVSAESRGTEWVFSVRDNGIGIDPSYFQRIFGLFQRLHGSAKYPGAGIGLAICKRIVENHGGRIWVESQPGQGTTFFFTLPGGAA